MEGILTSLEEGGGWKEAMRKCCRLNKLNVDVVGYFTPLRLRVAHGKFREMYVWLTQLCSSFF